MGVIEWQRKFCVAWESFVFEPAAVGNMESFRILCVEFGSVLCRYTAVSYVKLTCVTYSHAERNSLAKLSLAVTSLGSCQRGSKHWTYGHTQLRFGIKVARSRPLLELISPSEHGDEVIATLAAIIGSQSSGDPRAAVAERLAFSPPTKVNQIHSPDGSLPDFRKWESSLTMPLVCGVSRGLSRFPHPFIPALLHSHLISPSSALKTSLAMDIDLCEGFRGVLPFPAPSLFNTFLHAVFWMPGNDSLAHTVLDSSWRTLAWSSPSTVTSDNQCTVDIGIFVHDIVERRLTRKLNSAALDPSRAVAFSQNFPPCREGNTLLSGVLWRRGHQTSGGRNEDKTDVEHVYTEVDFANGVAVYQTRPGRLRANSRLARKQVASAILPGVKQHLLLHGAAANEQSTVDYNLVFKGLRSAGQMHLFDVFFSFSDEKIPPASR
ncbi:hypothetical protein PR048_018532 [Dryococelus australis]|uniref:Uncharacterized protein n=1 Tax=Dryococelus australis TaxID=614101 RepID=A0ABQ9HCQ0_9NEOP|nr:hypothetical protein PR048_018532 [Dryococelus australis]